MSRPTHDEKFMRAALREAKKGAGKTSPNPAVGAVLVAAGKIIAKGFHRYAGAPHAEAECLGKVRAAARDATLYVTLEPCSTTGRTPPCTSAIIAAGISRVVVGAVDPNPAHGGRGIKLLQDAGVLVESGVLAAECTALNRPFNKWIQTGLPYVIAKCGMSLDGRLTAARNESRWITSAAARQHANARRALVDAILVGAETVRTDNPRLTVRAIAGARQPWRVVLSRSGTLPRRAHLFSDAHADRTIVFSEHSLDSVLTELGKRGITSVLIEGGGSVLSQALEGRLIDAVEIYLGPVFTGGPVLAYGSVGVANTTDAVRLSNVTYEQIGNDVYMSAQAVPAE
ncbi:MAG: bifunctional diaminohydroxyphosphoribosylaminopyrimidine deaminase/5-amino-6-(5-phosphoribosylamino)uracil reductase RibD [Chthoniobacterales bacterium]